MNQKWKLEKIVAGHNFPFRYPEGRALWDVRYELPRATHLNFDLGKHLRETPIGATCLSCFILAVQIGASLFIIMK